MTAQVRPWNGGELHVPSDGRHVRSCGTQFHRSGNRSQGGGLAQPDEGPLQ